MRGACRAGDKIHSHCGHHPLLGGDSDVLVDGIAVGVDGNDIAGHKIPPCKDHSHTPQVAPAPGRCVFVNGKAMIRQEDPVPACQPMMEGSDVVEVVD